ncbi:hypothetical protein JCM31271_36370 [Halorubrum trueperi]
MTLCPVVQVTDEGYRQDHQAACADSLQEPEEKHDFEGRGETDCCTGQAKKEEER